ncbi:MAG: hypothetical protein FWF85_01330 [Clostridiales bacterium]|nr:hypothetical protein [Clostridiales bacterium]MDR2712155.1 hypothetical protein [Clostridiales bacterium]
MANVAVTFNADEKITRNFELACAEVGMSVSAGFNVLMRIALREQGLLFGDSSNLKTFQQQQQKAVHEFISSSCASEDELSDADYAELENGKYRLKLGQRGFAI